jgi:hypothetical protein
VERVTEEVGRDSGTEGTAGDRGGRGGVGAGNNTRPKLKSIVAFVW